MLPSDNELTLIARHCE